MTQRPLFGELPVTRRGFDNANMAILTWILIDRYRYSVSDISVNVDGQPSVEYKSVLLKSFAAGNTKDVFLAVDSIRKTGKIDSVTYYLPDEPEHWVRVECSGQFVLSPSCDRQEVWAILAQCLKGQRAVVRKTSPARPDPRVVYSAEELGMLAG